jgi:hypothetical protein
MTSMRRLQWGITVAVHVALAGLAATARAQTRGDEEIRQDAAEMLREEGKRLLDAGHIVEACRKLADSQRFSPAAGTLLDLADCLEKKGQTASAWTEFQAAAAMARAQGQTDREQIARERAAALEPTLATLIIRVSADYRRVPLLVKRDGAPLARPIWGKPIPVDPGVHMVEALAPGKKPWSTRVKVAARATGVTVTVPELIDDGAPRPPAHSMDEPPSGQAPPSVPQYTDAGRSQRIVGVVVGGIGLTGIGAGVGLGIQAISRNDESNEQGYCDANNFCNPTGIKLREEARSAGSASSALIFGGVAVLGAGVVLYLTAPSERTPPAPRTVRLDFTVHGGAAGIVAGGTW